MHRSGNEVSFWSAVAMGIGAMVGAGIFALLGQAGAIASSAVYISFLIGGGIALLSGYSMGRLGARYPAAGGVVEYLVQGFGPGRFSGTMSVMMYIAALVAVSLVARTFGSYAYALLPAGLPHYLVEVFSAAIVLFFMLVNLDGARSVTQMENLAVLIKMSVLVIFAAVGLAFIAPERLAPQTYPPVSAIFYSVAVTFFAYEGFRVVTNAAEDMRDPARTLPRAIMTAILLVIIVYVGIAITVFGNLPPEEVIAAKDFALAEAAKPVFGEIGFTVVAITALFATASAINASLYAVTNVTYQLAKLGECGHCGANFAAVGRDYLACSGARGRGNCPDARSIKRSELERVILEGLKARLMQPDLVKAFVADFHAEFNKGRRDLEHERAALERAHAETCRKLDGLIDAIADGLRAPGLQDKLDELERQKAEQETALAAPVNPVPRLHPGIAEIYRRKVSDLAQTLENPRIRDAALEQLRGLIDGGTHPAKAAAPLALRPVTS